MFNSNSIFNCSVYGVVVVLTNLAIFHISQEKLVFIIVKQPVHFYTVLNNKNLSLIEFEVIFNITKM